MKFMLEVRAWNNDQELSKSLQIEYVGDDEFFCVFGSESHSNILNHQSELEAHLKECHSESFEVESEDILKIDIDPKLEKSLLPLLKVIGVDPYRWNYDEESEIFYEEDVATYHLISDRVVIVNGKYWGVSAFGSVFPVDYQQYADYRGLVSMSFSETESMMSGWDSISVSQLDPNTFVIRHNMDDNGTSLTFFTAESPIDAVLSWRREAITFYNSFWDVVDNEDPFTNCLLDLLRSQDDKRCYWGLDIRTLDKEVWRSMYDEDVKTPASISAEWHFYVNRDYLPIEDVIKILQEI